MMRIGAVVFAVAVLATPGTISAALAGQAGEPDPPPCTSPPGTTEQSFGHYPTLVLHRRSRLSVNIPGGRIQAPAETRPVTQKGEGGKVETVILTAPRLGSLTVVQFLRASDDGVHPCTLRRPTGFTVVSGEALHPVAVARHNRVLGGVLQWSCAHLTSARSVSILARYELGLGGLQPKALGRRSRSLTTRTGDPCGSEVARDSGSTRPSIFAEPGVTPGFEAEVPEDGVAQFRLAPKARARKNGPTGPALIRLTVRLRLGGRTLATRSYCGVYPFTGDDARSWKMTPLRSRCPTR